MAPSIRDFNFRDLWPRSATPSSRSGQASPNDASPTRGDARFPGLPTLIDIKPGEGPEVVQAAADMRQTTVKTSEDGPETVARTEVDFRAWLDVGMPHIGAIPIHRVYASFSKVIESLRAKQLPAGGIVVRPQGLPAVRRLWLPQLQRMANELGVAVALSHHNPFKGDQLVVYPNDVDEQRNS
ncbi:hypothetical protein LJR230_005103 [Trinickia sp. LjRoot230]|uniref:hypothetical protein n=1 Tax=Trinickia sp. LjRoot230 TaxID=3342288 RepID=UPI003ECD2059